MRRERLEKFVIAHTERIPALDAQTLTRWIKCFTAFVVMQVAFHLGMAIDEILTFEVHSLDWLVSVYRTASVVVSSWILITCIFYWTVLQIMFSSQQQDMDKVITAQPTTIWIMESPSQQSGPSLTRVNDFELLLSALPFLWFMVGMVSSAGTVYGIIKGESDTRSIIISMRDYLPPVFVVLGITRVTQKIS